MCPFPLNLLHTIQSDVKLLDSLTAQMQCNNKIMNHHRKTIEVNCGSCEVNMIQPFQFPE